MVTMTKDQAKRFILSKQGLLGKYRFVGKQGAYQYIRQAGCIQYDTVDVCGKNAELTLQSRVRGFTRKMLMETPSLRVFSVLICRLPSLKKR